MASASANSQSLKLCKECRHSELDYLLDAYRCGHPDVEPLDLGSGEKRLADSARRYGACGRSARLFESRAQQHGWLFNQASQEWQRFDLAVAPKPQRVEPTEEETPTPRWRFDAPDGWTVLAIVASGALVVTGAWLVLT